MNTFRFWLFAGPLVLMSGGCAIAPLTQGDTARPVGEGRLELGFQYSGYTNSRGNYVLVPMGKVRYGVSPSSTVAVASELRTLSASFQHSYLQSDSATWFGALQAGLALIAGDISYFIGHCLSGHWGRFEPFLGLQLYRGGARPGSYEASFFNGSPEPAFFFLLSSFGVRFWCTEDLVLGLHGNLLFSTNEVSFHSPFLHSLTVAFLW